MWYFDGVIIATCNVCRGKQEIYVVDLDVNCYGGEYHENGMGQESNYEISQTYSCSKCGSEFEISFDATEYPVDTLTYVINNSKGVNCEGEPFMEYVDDSPIYTFPVPEIYIPSQRIITDLSELNNTTPRLIALIQKDSSYIHRISPREFEEIIAEIFRQQGFEVELTKRTRDGGKDVIAVHRNAMGIDTRYFIECKRYAPSNKVGVAIVRALYGVHSGLSGANKSIIATTSTFTSEAIRYANEGLRSKWEMDLKDIRDVLGWISNYKPKA
ncbi:MAG: restriction endonuclease [Gallionella sp.]